VERCLLRYTPSLEHPRRETGSVPPRGGVRPTGYPSVALLLVAFWRTQGICPATESVRAANKGSTWQEDCSCAGSMYV
jgi:hypothetical protein